MYNLSQTGAKNYKPIMIPTQSFLNFWFNIGLSNSNGNFLVCGNEWQFYLIILPYDSKFNKTHFMKRGASLLEVPEKITEGIAKVCFLCKAFTFKIHFYWTSVIQTPIVSHKASNVHFKLKYKLWDKVDTFIIRLCPRLSWFLLSRKWHPPKAVRCEGKGNLFDLPQLTKTKWAVY